MYHTLQATCYAPSQRETCLCTAFWRNSIDFCGKGYCVSACGFQQTFVSGLDNCRVLIIHRGLRVVEDVVHDRCRFQNYSRLCCVMDERSGDGQTKWTIISRRNRSKDADSRTSQCVRQRFSKTSSNPHFYMTFTLEEQKITNKTDPETFMIFKEKMGSNSLYEPTVTCIKMMFQTVWKNLENRQGTKIIILVKNPKEEEWQRSKEERQTQKSYGIKIHNQPGTFPQIVFWKVWTKCEFMNLHKSKYSDSAKKWIKMYRSRILRSWKSW